MYYQILKSWKFVYTEIYQLLSRVGHEEKGVMVIVG